MSVMMMVCIAAGVVLALVVVCVILAATFPPKECKGGIGAVVDVESVNERRKCAEVVK